MASGDVVNTAARLQAAAPVNGILVDETTYRATDQMIDVRAPRAPSRRRARSEPVARVGAARGTFTVRSRHRAAVAGAADRPRAGAGRARRTHSTACARARDAAARDARRRTGHRQEPPRLRALPGRRGGPRARSTGARGARSRTAKGSRYWALGEIVKAQAGILETDSAGRDRRQAETRRAPKLVDELRARVGRAAPRPLVGLESEQEPHGDRQPEAFAAWRRFFEALAEERPTRARLRGSPLGGRGPARLRRSPRRLGRQASRSSSSCTARPELLARRAGWGGGKRTPPRSRCRRSTTTRRRVCLAALLERSVLPAETQSRSSPASRWQPAVRGGVRSHGADRELVAGGEELPLPESVQGIVAARLDALPDRGEGPASGRRGDRQGLLAGRAPPASAGLERAAAEESLHGLERKEFVRRERRPSVGGRERVRVPCTCSFAMSPTARFRVPGELRSTGSPPSGSRALGRPEDHAEMLAHHYSNALELARAAGARHGRARGTGKACVARSRRPRIRARRSYHAARRFYAAAVEAVAARTSRRRAELLIRLRARPEQRRARQRRRGPHRSGRRCCSRPATPASGRGGDADLRDVLAAGRRDRAFEHLRAAEALVENEPSSYCEGLRHRQCLSVSGCSPAAARMRSVSAGRPSRWPRSSASTSSERTLSNNIGTSRLWTGDTRGFEDLEQSIAIADAINSVRERPCLRKPRLVAGRFR